MAVETTYYTQKKDRFFFISVLTLIIVIVLSFGLFWTNWYIEGKNAELWTEIANLDTSIKVLKQDKKIQIYDLIEANKWTLKNLKAKSQITTFIKHIKSLIYTYNMNLQKFDYANGIVTTQAVFNRDDKWFAYLKLAKFISEYRSKPENIMNLLFINSVTWQDQIELTTTFKVK